MKKNQIILALIIFAFTIFISATTTYFIHAYRYQRFQEAESNFYDDLESVQEDTDQASNEPEENHEREIDTTENNNNMSESSEEDLIGLSEEKIDEGTRMPDNEENKFVERVKRQAREYSDVFYLEGGFQPRVAISFDDGPSPSHTNDILEILKQYNIPATFFVLGSQVEYHPEILRAIHNDGHEVANHTYSHANFAEISLNQVIQEIEKTNDIIKSVIGYKPEIIRPPYGSISDSQLEYFSDKKYKFVNWSLDTRDWNEEINNSEIMLARVERLLHPGAIILLHDGGGDRANTVELLPYLIEYIEEIGYEFVTVSELLHYE
ncbi:MAG: polysaccharide deacetylase family protein [Bacillota bacterium]